MRKKLQIALLDSGIDTQSEGYASNNTYLKNEPFDQYGHGTMSFNLMKKHIGSYCDINIIKILDNNGKCNVQTLNRALIDLLDTDVDIINLSLSVIKDKNTEKYGELLNICNKLYCKNKIIICSMKNRESEYSIPAGYPTVLGVRAAFFSDDMKYWYNNDRKIQAIANGTPALLRAVNGQRKFFFGNSKATVVMTCIVARVLSGDYTCEINNTLYRNASRTNWSEEDVNSLYNSWLCQEEINKEKIDKQLLGDITDLLYQYYGDHTYNIQEFFTCNINNGAIIKIEDCIQLIDLIEQKVKCQFDDDIIKLTDFYNIYTLCYAVQERWSKHLKGENL